MEIGRVLVIFIMLNWLSGISCSTQKKYDKMENTFGSDLEFLKKHKDVIVLKEGNAAIAVIGDYQGRVMTSTSNGKEGNSYGWINYDLIASGKHHPHINAYGGEDRFWMGPEGGQYAIFFEKGSDFSFEDWQTPACIDTEPFDIVSKDELSVTFSMQAALSNYSGTSFKISVKRVVSILNRNQIFDYLNIAPAEDVRLVGYESINSLTNTGEETWKKENGLLSVWILGMFKPSDATTIVVPYRAVKDAESLVKDDYFGAISEERMVLKDSTLYLKADGMSRGKVGIPPEIVKPVAGSYDADKNILTIVQFNYKNDTCYVNSVWELQKEPYEGDVVNAYNDGPVGDDGGQLGPFYELETSSPAKELRKGETIKHIHRTFHFEGDKEKLNYLAEQILGVSLEEIEDVF